MNQKINKKVDNIKSFQILSEYKKILIAIVCLNFAACLRYFPANEEGTSDVNTSNTESIDKSGKNNLKTSKNLLGANEFFGIEEKQKSLLKDLLSSRGKLINSTNLGSYIIGVGDLIEINVFDVQELNTTVRVKPDGNITLHLLGEVKAINTSETELLNNITYKLKKFVKDPQVSLKIAEYEAQKISVIGEVTKPSTYPLKRSGYTLVELLSEAGGRTAKASNKILLSPLNSINPAIEIDLDELLGTSGKAPVKIPLLPGDTIVVPEVGEVNVDGEVVKPASYPLSSKTSLMGAIASAGGLTYSADINKVEVIRDIGNGKKAQIKVDLENMALKKGEDIRLRNGDVIRVPSASGLFATRQVVEVLNRIFNVGLNRRIGN